MTLRLLIAAVFVGVPAVGCSPTPPEVADRDTDRNGEHTPGAEDRDDERAEPSDDTAPAEADDDAVNGGHDRDDTDRDVTDRGQTNASRTDELEPPAPDDLPPPGQRNESEATAAAVAMITDPEAFGFPGPNTTGVVDERALEPAEGRISITQDGAVVENLHLQGFLYITADDVTVRNLRIETEHFYGIHLDGGSGLTVEDTEIRGSDDTCIAGIAFSDFTASRLHVTNCEDGLRVGDDTVVEDSYIHGLRKSRGDEHNDTIQTEGGQRMRFRNNTLISIWQRQTSAILLQAIARPIDDVVIEDNLMSGGSYTLYIEGAGGQPGPSDVTVRRNVFATGSSLYGLLQTQEGPEITWSGNRTATGAVLERDG